MNAIRKMAIFLGVGLLSAAILVAPVEANKTKKWPKSVSQEVTYGQAMQKPGMFEKTERRGIQKLSRVEVVRVLPENRKGQFMADLRGVLYTSLGTDAFTVRYASELAMILANVVWEEVAAKRGKIVWTPFGRAYRWTVDFHDYAMRKRPKDLTRFSMGSSQFQWHRLEKTVDGKLVPAESIWTIGPIFYTYQEALDIYPKITKQMGS
ncbi:MAG: hypothetical protein KDB57_04940 [Solirubrobacterales bacterium]|nr:hypothetical protein [Solirubrobacterales bacterium]